MVHQSSLEMFVFRPGFDAGARGSRNKLGPPVCLTCYEPIAASSTVPTASENKTTIRAVGKPQSGGHLRIFGLIFGGVGHSDTR
jgi:hypothetical protein